jgi:SNF2 family DNA or RNA helicase
MNRQSKTVVLNAFKQDASSVVLLASLKCASLGLNLTCANRVFLMDLWSVQNRSVVLFDLIGSQVESSSGGASV